MEGSKGDKGSRRENGEPNKGKADPARLRGAGQWGPSEGGGPGRKAE